MICLEITEAGVQLRMKILLILTFFLISGPVRGFKVIGYTGGSIIIILSHQHNEMTAVFFGKIKSETLDYLIKDSPEQKNRWVHEERFSLIDNKGTFHLIFRELSLQDEGEYRFGWAGVTYYEMTLIMKSDPCCTRSKTIRAHLGETVLISCKYPALFEKHQKLFYKQESDSITEMSYIKFSELPRDSISVDKQNKALRVNISDVREADGGTYFCAVINFSNPVYYYSSFNEIDLRVTEEMDHTTPTETTLTPQSDYLVIITVCVCVTQLLMGILVLVFCKMRAYRTQGSWLSWHSSRNRQMERRSEIFHTSNDCEEIHSTHYYCTIPLSENSSNHPTTIYSTAQLPQIPPNHPKTLYSTAQLPQTSINHPTTVYPTAQLLRISTDHPTTVYSTAQLPQTQKDHPTTVYSTAQLPQAPTSHPTTVYSTAQLPQTPTDHPETVHSTA